MQRQGKSRWAAEQEYFQGLIGRHDLWNDGQGLVEMKKMLENAVVEGDH